jgi:signal transduction histidine kinase
MKIVCRAARELMEADAATFGLREGASCFYAEEDAASPLRKGKWFSLADDISGRVMLNRQPAVIENVDHDPQVATDAYSQTLVKSLVMVPVSANDPMGVIGCYWNRPHRPDAEDLELLQALASATVAGIETVAAREELERRLLKRTEELEIANREMHTFSHAVSHDLGAPLRTVRSFSSLMLKEHGEKLDESGRHYLQRIHAAGQQMTVLINALLQLTKIARAELRWTEVDLSRVAGEIVTRLAAETPGRRVDVVIADGIKVTGDLVLLRSALENLFSNAWKHTSKTAQPRIEFGSLAQPNGVAAYYVRDNGAGFDSERVQNKLFQPFQQLHAVEDFPGSGVGLALVQRIIQRHGGKIRAEAAPDKGATFFFTLGPSPGQPTVPSSINSGPESAPVA